MQSRSSLNEALPVPAQSAFVTHDQQLRDHAVASVVHNKRAHPSYSNPADVARILASRDAGHACSEDVSETTSASEADQDAATQSVRQKRQRRRRMQSPPSDAVHATRILSLEQDLAFEQLRYDLLEERRRIERERERDRREARRTRRMLRAMSAYFHAHLNSNVAHATKAPHLLTEQRAQQSLTWIKVLCVIFVICAIVLAGCAVWIAAQRSASNKVLRKERDMFATLQEVYHD